MVQESLIVIAENLGVDPAEYLRTWLGCHIDSDLPDRYQRLVTDVVLRLPEGWDVHAEWFVTVNWENSRHGYGSVLRLEEGEPDTFQGWVVELYPALLDWISDAACRWVIAHEFAHVASGIPTGSMVIEGKKYTRIKGTVDQYQKTPSNHVSEDATDSIALGWGFSSDLQAFLKDKLDV